MQENIFENDLGGVSPEPWHLSYEPVASVYEKAFDVCELKKLLSTSDILLKDAVLENIDEIHQRFVTNISKV